MFERANGFILVSPTTTTTTTTTGGTHLPLIQIHSLQIASSRISLTPLTRLRSRTELYDRRSRNYNNQEAISPAKDEKETQKKDNQDNKHLWKPPWDIRSFLFQKRNGKQQKQQQHDQNEIRDISYTQQPFNDTLIHGDPVQNLTLTVVNQTQLEWKSKSHAIQPYNHSSQTYPIQKTIDSSSQTKHKSSSKNSKKQTTSSMSFDPFASMRYPSHLSINTKNSTKRTMGTTGNSMKGSIMTPTIHKPSSITLNLPLNITDPNQPLTFNDLQRILSSSGYVRRDEMNTMITDSNTNPMTRTSDDFKSDKSSSQRNIKGVAMPQPTKVSNKHIRYGTMIASGFFFILVATSIQPNLWLIGSAIGAVYGNDIATKAEMIANGIALEDGSGSGVVITRPGGLYGDISLKLGKRIATAYLQVWDILQTFWFLYRTGQLSYEYYQTYAKLDNRYGIQSKIDAWNSRFIEGKENFDRWEKENEVGRKLLAGMRTLWMVEENSYKKQMKGMKKSKYRIVRYVDGVIGWSKRFFRALWGSITGGGDGELREILKGMKLGMDELSLEIVSQRIGAAVAALIAVNFVGAMFAVAPIFLGTASVTLAVIFPNWFKDTIASVKDAVEEARARGRGERMNKPQVPVVQKTKLPLVNKMSFSYYIGTDGKKKWYRTGQSRFKKLAEENDSDAFQWPWTFIK